MLSRPIALSFAVALLLPAVATAKDNNNQGFILSEIQAGSELSTEAGEPRYRNGWVWVDPVADVAADAAAADNISKILYLNRCEGGCQIQPGSNDARANKSSIASGTVVISEYQWADAQWDEMVACVRDVYSPYDVDVVTEDPGDDFHHEAIVAGLASDLGLNPNIGGIAPSACQPLNNVISFSFANSPIYPEGDPLTLCWTVAQESAHSYGLPNHVFHCSDPMTYLDGNCGKKFFRNNNFPCGEFQLAPCNCSGATQNSHVELKGVFGAGAMPPAPELAILLPNPDAAVTDGFSIFWDALDERLILRTELWINGSKYLEIPGHDFEHQNDNYNVDAPPLPDGIIDLELRAYNQIGSESIQKITVTKGAACTGKESCFDFQECNAGRCEYGPATAELGDSCNVDPNCLEGACAEVDGDRACATECTLNVADACLEGFECVESSGGGVCWPKGETGGCCSVAGSKHDPLPWFGLGLFLVGLMFLRRRKV